MFSLVLGSVCFHLYQGLYVFTCISVCMFSLVLESVCFHLY